MIRSNSKRKQSISNFKYLAATSFVIFLWGCQSAYLFLEKNSQRKLEMSGSSDQKINELALEKNKVEQIQTSFDQNQCDSVFLFAEEFYFKYPNSQYLSQVKLAEAECHLQQENYNRAVGMLLEVARQMQTVSPQISARSYLLLSYGYEGLGQMDKSLSTILDADKLSANLPLHSRLAEVPARLALLYSKMSDLKQAGLMIDRAEEGLRVLKTSNPQFLGSIFWAKIYFFMGYSDSDQVYLESLSEFIQGLMAVQKYSIKSLEFDEPIWSQKALSLLEKNYQNLLSIILVDPPEQSKYFSLDAFKIKEQRLNWLYELSDLAEQAELFHPSEETVKSVYSKKFFDWLTAFRSRVNSAISENARKTRLTEESIRLNSIYRTGRVYPSQFFPNEMKEKNSK